MFAALVAAAIVVGAASCAMRDGETEVPVLVDPPSTMPSISVDEDASARADVLLTYNGYLKAVTAALAQGSTADIDLTQYVGDPLLTELGATIGFYRERGIVHKGQPVWNPRVTALRAGEAATIEDCFDSTEWVAVYEATGEPAAGPDQVQHYLIISPATFFPEHRWPIAEPRAERSPECSAT